MVIVDEAAQATAPNAWNAVLRGRQAVLVGDPEQLPPTILSRDAAAAGLDTTLMSEAIAAAPSALSRLATQYRMHEAINAFPSAAFYAGELRAHPSVSTRLLSEIDGVARTELTDAPLVGIRVPPEPALVDGNERRAAGGNVVNLPEAHAAVAHVAALLRAGVHAADIVLISPYSAQVAWQHCPHPHVAKQPPSHARAATGIPTSCAG